MPPKELLSWKRIAKLAHIKTLFVANENIWCKVRDPVSSYKRTYGCTDDLRSDSKKSAFYTMLDVNRCLYLTSGRHAEKLASPKTYFQNTLLELCMIKPTPP